MAPEASVRATAGCPNPYITAVEPAGSKGD